MNYQTSTKQKKSRAQPNKKDGWECKKYPCYETSFENQNM